MAEEFLIRSWQPGDLGYVAYRHAVLYTQEYQLEPIFEAYVLESLLKFAKAPADGQLWLAESNGRVAGFIAIIGIDAVSAQLRWFLIEPEFRGRGLGKKLVKLAMDYCREKHYQHIFLWTFRGLAAACHLYAEQGFVMTETVPNNTWKPGILEERWDWHAG